MSLENITSNEPTPIKWDPNDQEIVVGQTNTNTEQAKERYGKEGMTKV